LYMVEAIYRTFRKDVLVDGQIPHARFSVSSLSHFYNPLRIAFSRFRLLRLSLVTGITPVSTQPSLRRITDTLSATIPAYLLIQSRNPEYSIRGQDPIKQTIPSTAIRLSARHPQVFI
jgi:hypothetical protein